jgi:hypothetical protein
MLQEGEDPATGSRVLDYFLENTTPWPSGAYRVEISVNGKLDQVVNSNMKE